jgi:hypothetical protein
MVRYGNERRFSRTPSGAQWTSGICLLVSKLDLKVTPLRDSRITHLGYAGTIFEDSLFLKRFYFQRLLNLTSPPLPAIVIFMKTAMRLRAICISGIIS